MAHRKNSELQKVLGTRGPEPQPCCPPAVRPWVSPFPSLGLDSQSCTIHYLSLGRFVLQTGRRRKLKFRELKGFAQDQAIRIR